jgi:hypothetical protein
MIPAWKAGQYKGGPAVIFDAVGILQTWRWAGESGQFVLVPKPAPKPAAAPAGEKPPEADPAPSAPAPAVKKGS